MEKIKEYQRKYRGYKNDSNNYKRFRNYYDEYCQYCRENRLIEISREDFLKHLKETMDKQVAQNFIDMMFAGKKLGECQKHFSLSFDEVSVIMESSIVRNSYFGKKVNL